MSPLSVSLSTFRTHHTRSQVHPRWLVTFEGPSKDEEVYEHTFIKVLESAEPEGTVSGGETMEAPPKSRPAPANNTKKTTTNKNNRKHDDRNDDIKMEETSEEPAEQQQKRSVAFSNESSPSGEESSSAVDTRTESAKVSAREERSRRRQAIIDEYGVLTGAALSNGKRKLGNASSSNGGNGNKNSKSNKRAKSDDDEKCHKVKLLTGTLYLYRGRNRRAEFVRRV